MNQKSKALVSVVLPFFNAEKTLERAVRSIINQTYQNIELILVNNNSSDNSMNIVWLLAAEDKRIRVMEERKQGVSFAANKGNMEAKGVYIARMDADDFAYPNRIEKQVRLLEENPSIDVASCMVKHVAHHKETKGLATYTEWTNSLIEPAEIALNRFIESTVINPSILFRKELLHLFGGYEHGNFPEDYDLLLRWLGKGVRIKKVNEVLLDWYDSDNRLTRSDERYSQDAFYKTKAKHLSKWLLKNDHPYFWVWGAGRVTRKRINHLLDHGLFVEGFIDVKRRELGEFPCLTLDEFNWEAPSYILSYVGNRGAREEIRNFLNKKGKEEGIDFLVVA